MFWSREVGWTRNSSASMIFGQLITVLIALRLGEKSQPSILIFNSFPHQEARHVWTKSWDILFHCPDFYFLACRCKDLTGSVYDVYTGVWNVISKLFPLAVKVCEKIGGWNVVRTIMNGLSCPSNIFIILARYLFKKRRWCVAF